MIKKISVTLAALLSAFTGVFFAKADNYYCGPCTGVDFKLTTPVIIAIIALVVLIAVIVLTIISKKKK